MAIFGSECSIYCIFTKPTCRWFGNKFSKSIDLIALGFLSRILLMRRRHPLRRVSNLDLVRFNHFTTIDNNVDLVKSNIARGPIGAVSSIVVRAYLKRKDTVNILLYLNLNQLFT